LARVSTDPLAHHHRAGSARPPERVGQRVTETAGKRGPYRKNQVRRREIIAAALDVFSTSGYRGGSLKEIGARIGIDASTILHHFSSKEELLQAVLDDKIAHDFEIPPDWDSVDPRSMPATLLALAERNDTLPGVIALYALLSAESTTPGHPSSAYFRDRTATTIADFRRGFQAMADAGLLAPRVTAEFAARSTFALWDGIQVHWLIDPETVSVVDTLRAHLRMITQNIDI
jgi:AcrR family transcriptional regulator